MGFSEPCSNISPELKNNMEKTNEVLETRFDSNSDRDFEEASRRREVRIRSK